MNLRHTSVDTVRTCKACGHDFLATLPPEPPATPTNWSGCLITLVVVGAIVTLVPAIFFCGVIGLFSAVESAQPPETPKALDRKTVQSSPPRTRKQSTDVAKVENSDSDDPPLVLRADELSKPLGTQEQKADAAKADAEGTPPELRMWSSARGQFTIKATFVRLANGKVRLRKEDGTEIDVDEEKLSAADRAFIEHKKLSFGYSR